MSQVRPIDELFGELIQLESAEQRARFLDEIGSKDSELRAQLERLAESHQQAGSFLLDSSEPGTTVDHSPGNLVETTIGPYKLLQKIGEGGMGEVYMAEQVKPVERRVAVKIIKPGMDSRQVIARFEAERQALAMMDHPNIAKVLEAGTTENGRPYFVMELVKGIPITQYCDEQKLTIRQRLELFMRVCQAIQHAHQKGIIHRDIKPSNVLVAQYDGKPVPKIIDFGVAKAISQKLTEKTIFTQYGQIVGTLEYMSPEQAQFNQLDVDTRSDIYSLGVLLYELLTGETPFDGKRLRSSAFEEVLKIICEEDPPRPSNRISTLGARATSASKNRNLETAKLSTTIRGDLDWIVMKAIEKDRDRRYGGASDFAADIDRLLKSKPIEARPPSLLYRLGRAYKRNQAAVVSCLLVGVALAMGLGFALFGLQQKYATLAKYRIQTVKTTFEKAINGDKDFDESFAIATASGVSQDWLNTLRGAQFFHNGDNEKAMELFDSALAINEENTAAWGLKAVALIDQGDFQRWTSHIADSELYQPRPDYEDIDNLCLAYATYHTDLDNAVLQFEDILADHPTWNMARAIYAAALAEKGEQSGDAEPIHRALIEASHAYHVTPGNRFAQLVYVLTRSIAIRANTGDAKSLLNESMPVANQLAKKSGYDIGHLLYADLCSLASEHIDSEFAVNREVAAWRGLTGLDGNYASRAFAELFRLGRIRDVIDARPSDPEAQLARAIVLAQDQDSLNQAHQILDEHARFLESTYMQMKIVELQLILKRPKDAQDRCRSWLNAKTSGSSSEYESFRLTLAERLANGSLEDLETRNAWQKFIKEYFLALWSFSTNEMDQAKEHLEYCAQHRSMNVADHWVRAFLERWEW